MKVMFLKCDFLKVYTKDGLIDKINRVLEELEKKNI